MELKAKIKISKDALAIIVAVVLIAAYVIGSCYTVNNIELETQTAVKTTFYEKIDAKALIVREEHSLNDASSGIIVPLLSDGDKINKGGLVAATFSSNEQATQYSRYNELLEEIEYYEGLEAQTVGQASSVEALNAEISNDIDSYIQAISTGDSQKVESCGNAVNDILLHRQMIIGQEVDLSSRINSLKAELANCSAKPSSTVSTDASGVFSSYTDGYEQSFDYSKVNEMTPEQVEQSIKTVESKGKNTVGYGKLITNCSWYMQCVVNPKDILGLKNNSTIKVALKNNSNVVLNATIVSGIEANAGADKTVLVLKCNEMNGELSKLRVEDIEIRIKEHEGFRVPARALHVVDGKKGVYALISSKVKFREASVISSDGDYFYLSYDNKNKNGIHIYDKIILQGKDLEDGKIYT